MEWRRKDNGRIRYENNEKWKSSDQCAEQQQLKLPQFSHIISRIQNVETVRADNKTHVFINIAHCAFDMNQLA